MIPRTTYEGSLLPIVSLAALLGLSLVLYVRGGLPEAYLVEDDFQWLAGGHTFDWSRLFDRISGEHFYRPVVDVWFALGARVCGFDTACYHIASLGVHLLNVSLVFGLALLVSGSLRFASLGTLLFAVQPAYVQAVVWVSAVTGLLSTLFYLSSLVTQAVSWRVSSRSRAAWELAAVAFFLAALFSHEAAATLPVVAWLMWREFHGNGGIWKRPMLVWGFAAGLLVFAIVAVTANRSNAVFTESDYAIGPHAIEHALDYMVAMHVGPSWWFSYAASVAGVALLLVMAPTTRFGAGWLIVTLLPYVWFTGGSVSRYHYLPSIGFALAVAGATVVGCSWLARRYQRGGAFAAFVYVAMVLFVAVRFSRFDSASIRGRVESMEPWRGYASVISSTSDAREDAIHVALPDDDLVHPRYIRPLVQWIHRDYVTEIVFESLPRGQL